MRIFDSHCHLDDDLYSQDMDAVIHRAHEADVMGMMVVGLGIQGGQRAIDLAAQYSGVYIAVGIHPHDAQTCDEQTLTTLSSFCQNPKVRAWGETGLDFNRMHSPRGEQEKWFKKQLDTAAELDLPMIFHERDSQGRFLEILRSRWHPNRLGVVHCFSGSDAELDAYIELGLYIGITGILTVKGRGRDLRRQVKRIPFDRLLVETDAPYLTPTPERNKFRRNEPAFVRTVLLKLADLYNRDPATMADITWTNTCSLFKLQDLMDSLDRE